MPDDPMPFLHYLQRQARLEELAERAFRLARDLGEAEPTAAGIAVLTIEARWIATELEALRASDTPPVPKELAR